MAIPSHLRDAFNTHMRNLIATAGLNETAAEHQFGEMIGWLGQEQRKLAKAAANLWPDKIGKVMALETFAFAQAIREMGEGQTIAQLVSEKGKAEPPALKVIEGGATPASDN